MKRLSIMLLASALWSGCGDTTAEEVDTLQTQEAAAAACNCTPGEGWLCKWSWNSTTSTWRYNQTYQACNAGGSQCWIHFSTNLQCADPCVDGVVYPGPCAEASGNSVKADGR